ncbi:MAG: hypothetical protein H6Q19_255 [Bacteroidetes bacterium]|nr:hypothetical protein [Bacteroidota bacterium]
MKSSGNVNSHFCEINENFIFTTNEPTKTRRHYNHSYKVFWLVFIFLVLMTFKSWAQTAGDYRTATTGNWMALSTWQRYNGMTWTTPSITDGYPGQNTGTGAIHIQTGHTVSIGSTGITTQPMGTLTISGTLNLTGGNSTTIFSLNTMTVIDTGTGVINFYNKTTLSLPANAIIQTDTGALAGDCNNNCVITIGSITFAACSGAPGSIYTFAQIMAGGGTINAIASSNSPICEGNTISLTGNYSGAIGTAPTYSWTVTAPGGGVTTYITQNVIINTALKGTYTATLKVTTTLSGMTYTNSEPIQVVVNPLPTLGTISQFRTVCDGSSATINLTGLVPSNTFTVNYKINNVAQPAVTGLISSATGTSSFQTTALAASNNGQTLEVTSITITNPLTNCGTTFTGKTTTLSVWTTGPGTWIGQVSTDWDNPANWCGGVPNLTTDVIIPPVSSPNVLYQPVIGTTGGNCRNITIDSGASLTVSSSNSLNIYGNWTNNGTFTPNMGTVSFTGSSSAQTIGGSGTNAFYNLIINNTATGGGVKAASNITVNETLNLIAANPSATVGALEMVTSYGNYPRTTAANVYVPITSYTLTMGNNATTTGQGDVTGKIYRSDLSANTAYTFGNQYTTYAYTVAPTDVMVIVTIGTAYGDGDTWGYSTSIKRSYEMIPNGGTGGRVAMNLHYIDSELNGNTESSLTTGDFDVDIDGGTLDGAPLGDEHGRSSYDYINNYIGLSGIPMDYFQSNSTHNWRTIFNIHDYSEGHTVWDGSESTAWNNDLNWSAGIPGDKMTAIIPDASTTPNDPILAAGQTIGGLQILFGGIMNFNGQTLTINANNYSGFEDQSGLSNYNGSTVIIGTTTSGYSTPILGIPHFDNLTINSGASATAEANSHIYISGTFTNNGAFVASTFDNTVEYNGGAQTVVDPQNNIYYSLTLSGSGTKTLPPTLSVSHEFVLGGAATPLGTTLNVGGNFINNSSGSWSVTNVNLNGTATQILGGSIATTFTNLTINNTAGVTITNNATSNGTLNLAIGLLTTGSYTMTVGCSGDITYPVYPTSTSYINGKLARVYCTTGSKTFPIGKGGNYRPLTLEYTALSGTSTVTAEQFESPISGSIPANTYYQTDRYWTITQTGGSAFAYNLTLNGDPFNPGSGSPVIVKGDGTTNSSVGAAFNSPNFSTITGQTSFSNFAVGSECTPPVINTQPVSVSVCDNSGTAVFSVSATGSNSSYQWEVSTTGTGGTFSPVANGSVYSGAATVSLSIANPSYSMNGYAYRVVITRDCGSSVTSDGTSILTVNVLPTITLGVSPEVCEGSTSALLTYSATSGSPDQYMVDFDATAEAAGFSDISFVSLESPISLTVPVSVGSGTYNGTLFVKNSTTGCISNGYAFTVTIWALPQGSLAGNNIYSGGTAMLTWTASSGSGPYTLVYDPGNVTVNNVESGIPFSVGTVYSTTTYTLVSVTGVHGCARTSGFTGASASVIVTSRFIWTGSTSSDWNTAVNWVPAVVPSSGNNVEFATVANYGTVAANDMMLPYNSSTVVHDLTNLSDKAVVVPAGSSLTVSGIITGCSSPADASKIQIKAAPGTPNGTFIINCTAQSGSTYKDVYVTVDLYAQGYKDTETNWTDNIPGSPTYNTPFTASYHWQYFGVPVASVTSYPTFSGSFLRKYFENYNGDNTQYYQKWKKLTNDSILTAFKGYEITQRNKTVYSIPGKLQYCDKSITLTRSAPAVSGSGDININNLRYGLGQNIFGNSYTASIDIDKLDFASQPKIEPTVYLYNTGSFTNWGNTTGGGLNDGTAITAGQYTSIPQNTAPAIYDGKIPSMNGFLLFHRGTEPYYQSVSDEPVTITLPYADVAINTKPQTAPRERLKYLHVNLASKSTNDNLWLFSQEGTTSKRDDGWDGRKFFGTPTAFIYTENANGPMQVNADKTIDGEVLSFYANEDTEYTLNLAKTNLHEYASLQLIDLVARTVTPLDRDTTTYRFTADSKGTSIKRFIIANSTYIDLSSDKFRYLNGYVLNNNRLIISNLTPSAGTMYLYDISGKTLINRNISTAVTEIPVSLQSGVYILSLKADGKQETIKLIIK